MNIDPAAVLALQCDLVTRLAAAEQEVERLTQELDLARAALRDQSAQ